MIRKCWEGAAGALTASRGAAWHAYVPQQCQVGEGLRSPDTLFGRQARLGHRKLINYTTRVITGPSPEGQQVHSAACRHAMQVGDRSSRRCCNHGHNQCGST